MKNNGITLVSLIVTIIILLILVGFSIVQLTESGLLEKARLAKEKTENAQIEEKTEIDNYESEINNVLYATRSQSDSKEYCYLFKKENSLNVSSNSIIQFEKIEGNMNFDDTDYTVALKANKHYFIDFSARTMDSSADYGDFIIYNATLEETIKQISWAEASWKYCTTQLIYTPKEDSQINIKVTSTGNIDYIAYPSLTIYEI